jgi:hypothetical protein
MTGAEPIMPLSPDPTDEALSPHVGGLHKDAVAWIR